MQRNERARVLTLKLAVLKEERKQIGDSLSLAIYYGLWRKMFVYEIKVHVYLTERNVG